MSSISVLQKVHISGRSQYLDNSALQGYILCRILKCNIYLYLRDVTSLMITCVWSAFISRCTV